MIAVNNGLFFLLHITLTSVNCMHKAAIIHQFLFNAFLTKYVIALQKSKHLAV